MKILLNDEPQDTHCTRLTELLEQLGYNGNSVATAINGAFVPRHQRETIVLAEGMKVEIVSPMQGG